MSFKAEPVPDNSQALQQWAVPARGRQLDMIGAIYGNKRRWWGWEPDFLYRRRMRKAVLRLKK